MNSPAIPTLAKILRWRIRIRSLVLLALLAAYVGLSFVLFFQWIAPTLDGRVDQHIAADSSTYIDFANALREGEFSPPVVAALATFPNTLWVPVLLALVLKSTFFMAIADYAMFFLALFLLKRAFAFSAGTFLVLLLINATTTISLLSVNKEIVDLLAIALFLFARRKGSRIVLLLALLLALLNRFEVCVFLVTYLVAASRLNPLRYRRGLTLLALLVLLSIVLPIAASRTLAAHFVEASTSNTVTLLDTLEMHYLFGLSAIPKIAENFFAELFNVSKWIHSYSVTDLANSYIVFSDNLANLIVIIVLLGKRALTLRADLIYFACIGSIIMAISLVIQPRYFYCVYVVLCLQAAISQKGKLSESALFPSPYLEPVHA